MFILNWFYLIVEFVPISKNDCTIKHHPVSLRDPPLLVKEGSFVAPPLPRGGVPTCGVGGVLANVQTFKIRTIGSG
jgi:hypothetical protein